RIPFICKLNHNELMTYPNHYDQVLFGTVREAWELGAAAVGATIYWGSEESDRQLIEIAAAFHQAHELGMATVLWCYVRNPAFKKDGVNYETAADLTGQANLRHQQARGRDGVDLGTEVVPASDEGGDRAVERHSGRIPQSRGDRRLKLAFLGTGSAFSPERYNGAIVADGRVLLDAGAP